MKKLRKFAFVAVILSAFGANLVADDFIYYPQGNAWDANNAFAPRGFMQNSEETKMFYGNILQMATFHIGANFLTSRLNNALGADNKKVAMDLGVSVGWNYFEAEDEEIDMGLRLKYLYTKSDYKTHSVGLVAYLHPYTYPIMYNSPIIQPLSFLLGGGYSNSTSPHGANFNGGYVEAGVALFKYFPLNLDIIYRATFYGKKGGISPQTTHSVSLMINVL
ncbi:hypothetical protein ACWIUD_11435 [Helicobacter sp. 23-1044]